LASSLPFSFPPSFFSPPFSQTQGEQDLQQGRRREDEEVDGGNFPPLFFFPLFPPSWCLSGPAEKVGGLAGWRRGGGVGGSCVGGRGAEASPFSFLPFLLAPLPPSSSSSSSPPASSPEPAANATEAKGRKGGVGDRRVKDGVSSPSPPLFFSPPPFFSIFILLPHLRDQPYEDQLARWWLMEGDGAGGKFFFLSFFLLPCLSFYRDTRTERGKRNGLRNGAAFFPFSFFFF